MGFSIRRVVVAAGVIVVATMTAGCAATGTADTGRTSASSTAESTVASTSSVAAAASSATPSSPASVQSPAAPSPTDGPPTVPPPPDTTELVTDATSAEVTEPPTPSSAAPIATDGSQGWYDTWGWVSPQTAERALAAGIAAGKDVRDELRCGTDCGESPTAAEIQAQYILDHPDNPNATLEAYETAAAACPGYFIRGNCYADAAAAQDAGEGE